MDDVTIEAIKFDHDPSSADRDALTIRKNEDDGIELPEWVAGVRKSPAAYVCAPRTGLTIEIQLGRNNSSVRSVEVSARSKGILVVGKDEPPVVVENILGQLRSIKPIEFGDDSSKIALVSSPDARLGDVGVGKWNVICDWTLTPKEGEGEPAEIQTHHEIYTVFGSPCPPWGPDPEDPEYEYEPPWVDVLEKACEWARGANDPIGAASEITRKLHSLGQLTDPDSKTAHLKFNENRTFSRLALNGTDSFVFSETLKRLNAGETITVNCRDCAILVSSFANILGCNLFQSEMGPGFFTNYIREIGSARERKTRFKFHEVAWEQPFNAEANLFDCFLEVDGDSKPAVKGFVPLLPVNIPFGDQKSQTYHFRLVNAKAYCVPSGTGIRRKIARTTFSPHKIHPQLKESLTKEFNFPESQKFAVSEHLFTEPVKRLAQESVPAGWTSGPIRTLTGETGVCELCESVWYSSDIADTVVRVLIYRCDSVLNAHDFLRDLLGDFQFAGVKSFELPKDQERLLPGDLAFSGPEDEAVLFARSNVVAFYQSIGSASFPALQFACALDEVILRALKGEILKGSDGYSVPGES